jgi:phage tail-like protein
MANGQDPLTTFNFEVQLTVPDAASLGMASPLCAMEFSDVDGLEMTMETKTVREGGNNTQQIHLVGPVAYGNLTLKRGMTSNQDIWKWFSAVTSGARRGARASGIVLMRDRDAAQGPTVRFKLTGCLPIKVKAPALNAKNGILAIEEMQLAYTSFTVELP